MKAKSKVQDLDQKLTKADKMKKINRNIQYDV